MWKLIVGKLEKHAAAIPWFLLVVCFLGWGVTTWLLWDSNRSLAAEATTAQELAGRADAVTLRADWAVLECYTYVRAVQHAMEAAARRAENATP